MPTMSRLSQADLERAIRAIKKEVGHATVIYEPNGRVRVVPIKGTKPEPPPLQDRQIHLVP